MTAPCLPPRPFTVTSRAGESGGGLVVVDGVETIDASNVPADCSHSYFAEDRRIMEDPPLLQGGQRAADRLA
jgi:hypothetical protein